MKVISWNIGYIVVKSQLFFNKKVNFHPQSKHQVICESALIEQLSRKWLIWCCEWRLVTQGQRLHGLHSLTGESAHSL